MNINELDDVQKSAALLRLCGWRRDGRELYSNDKLIYTFPMYSIEGEYIHAYEFQFIANLYDPANMALAWRVLNWAVMSDELDSANVLTELLIHYCAVSPAIASIAWLDKILSLAIEAGMVKE